MGTVELSPTSRRRGADIPDGLHRSHGVHVRQEGEHEEEDENAAGAVDAGEHEPDSSMDGAVSASLRDNYAAFCRRLFDHGTVVTVLGVGCPERGTGRVAKSMVSRYVKIAANVSTNATEKIQEWCIRFQRGPLFGSSGLSWDSWWDDLLLMNFDAPFACRAGK